MRFAFLVIATWFCITSGIPFPLFAYRVPAPIDRVVTDCDLIVQGELQSLVEEKIGHYDVASGRIKVTEAIWPNQPVADELVFVYRQPIYTGCPRISYNAQVNQAGFWCVRRAGEDSVTANHDAWQDLSKKEEILAALRGHPIVTQIHPWPYLNRQYEKEILPELHVVIRNMSNDTLFVPRIEETAYSLHVDQDICIQVRYKHFADRWFSLLEPKKPIRYRSRFFPKMRVLPGRERRIIIHLDQWYPLENETYFVRLWMRGNCQSRWLRFKNRLYPQGDLPPWFQPENN